MAAIQIVKRDLLRMMRSPGRTALLFAIPLVLAGIFAMVFGGDGVDEIVIRVLIYDEDDQFISRLLTGAAGNPQMDERLQLVKVGREGYAMMDEGEASAMIHIPKGFSDDFLEGKTTTLKVIKNPSHRFLPKVVEEGAGILADILSQASIVFRPELKQLQEYSLTDTFPTDLSIAALSMGVNKKMRGLDKYLFPPIVELESVEPAPEETAIAGDETAGSTSILSFFLPGLAVLCIFFLAQASTRDILADRDSGLLRHLLTAPVSMGDYLLGKCLSVLVVTALGFALIVGIGLAAGVGWGDPVAATALIAASAVAASGTLLLLMSLVKTQRQADGLTTIVIIAWAMLGGSFVPLSQMPGFVLTLSKGTLTFWATHGFNRLIFEGAGPGDIVVNLAVLLSAGLVFLLAGIRLLQRKLIAGGL